MIREVHLRRRVLDDSDARPRQIAGAAHVDLGLRSGERGCHRRSEERDQHHRDQHPGACRHAAEACARHRVAVADRRERRDRPPHAEADAVLALEVRIPPALDAPDEEAEQHHHRRKRGVHAPLPGPEETRREEPQLRQQSLLRVGRDVQVGVSPVRSERDDADRSVGVRDRDRGAVERSLVQHPQDRLHRDLDELDFRACIARRRDEEIDRPSVPRPIRAFDGERLKLRDRDAQMQGVARCGRGRGRDCEMDGCAQHQRHQGAILEWVSSQDSSQYSSQEPHGSECTAVFSVTFVG